jgi:uncharacterized protein HemX
MDFIVLGLIPGTHIQLTFVGYLLLAPLLLGVGIYYFRKVQKHRLQSTRRHFDVISLRSLEQA